MNSVQSASAPKDVASSLLAVAQLTKPRVTRVVVATAWCGAVMAPGEVAVPRLILSLLATAIVVGSANALNMYVERETDAAMERTRTRPLPSGKLSPEVALWFGIATGLFGLAALALVANALAAMLAGVAWLSYVLVYTPLKPITPHALYVGAVPGALPPLIGWAAMTGALTPFAWSVFAFLLFWQVPHFLAIAVFRSDEYRRAGLRVLPTVRGVRHTKWAIMLSSVAVVAVSLVPYRFGCASLVYVVVCLTLGIGFVSSALWGFWTRDTVRWARSHFIASLPYMILVYGTLVFVSL